MKRAFIVGINKYHSAPLRGCVNDADSIATLLERNEDNSVNFSVNKLTDIQSRGDLKRGILECFDGTNEIALFYFSGHGYIDSFGGYLVTPDCQKDDVGISMCEILEIVNNSMCANKVVILDCCNSGYMGNVSTKNQTTVIQEGVSILTACRAGEPAMEQAGHGIFTSLLLEALNGGAADLVGNITTGGVYAFIDKALGVWEQRPIFKTNISKFSPIRKVNPQVSLDIIHKINIYFNTPDHIFPLDPSFEDTNAPIVPHEVIEPHANPENTKIFKELQKMVSIGLVKPYGDDHMYFAAMKSKSCKLTPLGQHYWDLVNKKII